MKWLKSVQISANSFQSDSSRSIMHLNKEIALKNRLLRCIISILTKNQYMGSSPSLGMNWRRLVILARIPCREST
jgi:hypothetical protein